MNNKQLRIPAEWELHEAAWISWPHNKEDWPGKFSPIQWVYSEIVKKISEGEKVRIILQSKQDEKRVRSVLLKANAFNENVEFFYIKTDRGWTRDSFPAFVKDGSELIQISFKFNGWAKYDNYKLDRKIPPFVSRNLKLKTFTAEHKNKEVVLEGGSIDYNGLGSLLTTEECLLDDKVQVRNPGFSREDYEEVFNKYLGITNTIWLGKGIAGDDTHGHVDDLCRFVNPSTVILVSENNPNDVNYTPLKENKERLSSTKLENGGKLNVIDIPMPSPVYFDKQRLPASYANFFISNSAVLVPTFNDPNDKTVLGILSDLFTDRKVVGIHSLDLVWGLGTIHCLTHEQPSKGQSSKAKGQK